MTVTCGTSCVADIWCLTKNIPDGLEHNDNNDNNIICYNLFTNVQITPALNIQLKLIEFYISNQALQ